MTNNVLLVIVCLSSLVTAQNIGGGSSGSWISGIFWHTPSYSSHSNSAWSSWEIGLAVAVAVIVALFIAAVIYDECNKPRDAQKFLAAGALQPMPLQFPKTCKWKGYYEGHSKENSGVHVMHFSRSHSQPDEPHPNISLSLKGRDDNGPFAMEGRVAPSTWRVALTKSYKWRDHKVEYRGSVDPRCPGLGVAGVWFIEHKGQSDTGTFRMWWTKGDFDLDRESEHEREQVGTLNSTLPTTAPSLAVSDPCFICQDEDINCLLLPCKHAATCQQCANSSKGGNPCCVCNHAVEQVVAFKR